MARKENIVNRRRKGLPFLAPTAKAGHTLLAVSSLTRSCGDHMRNRFPMPGDHHGLATLNLPKEFCQACLGFCGFHRVHRRFRPVKMTGLNGTAHR